MGHVWPSSEEKCRSPIGKCSTSEYVNGTSCLSQYCIATGALALTKPSFSPLSYASWLAFQLWLGSPDNWHGEVA